MPTIVNQLGIATTDQVIYTQANQPVVEPLGGNISLTDLMKRFPEEVYHAGPDTRLYKFIQALCGDSGAGILKAQSLAIRLKNEGPLLVFHDLDTFYAHVFNFPRIRRELYNYDAATQELLDVNYDPTNVSVEKEIWDKINAADSSYQKRVLDFMHATRLGNSPDGIELAAKAGSGEECDVIENYKFIFDQYSDDPLGLDQVGDTNGTSEFVIMPSGTANVNDNVQANIVTLEFTGSPTSGTFRLKYENLATSDITWDGTDISEDIYLGLLGTGLFALTDISVVVDITTVMKYTITVNNPQFDALFFGVDDNSLDTGDINFDYPLGDSYYMADFQYPLAKFYEDNYVEIMSGHLDTDHPVTDSTFFADNVALGPTVHLTPDIEYNLIRTVDNIRPVGTVMTVKPKRAAQIQAPAADVFASSENFNLIRWVTGNPSVAWPPLDASQGFFIQGVASANGVTANVENEATTFAFGTHVFPALFQTVVQVFAYTEQALNDSVYNTGSFFSDRYILYKSEHQGKFDALVSLIFPFLQQVSDNDFFQIPLVVPAEPTPLLASAPYVVS